MTIPLETFFALRPGMKKKFEFPGTFNDLCSTMAASILPVEPGRKLKAKILEHSGRLLTPNISIPALNDQLSRCPILSTADHFALLNYKLLYNSNLLYSHLVRFLGFPYMVVPATGSIPLVNNTYPRGFYFNQQKLNFFPERKSRVPVFLFDSQLSLDGGNDLKNLVLNIDQVGLTGEQIGFLDYLFFEALDTRDIVTRYHTFSGQITNLNFRLWPYYFHRDIRPSIPGLVYLQVNPMIQEILVDELRDPGSLVSWILFDRAARKIFLRHFNGIYGAWDDNHESKGSHFFWGIPGKGKMIPLRLDERQNLLCGNGMALPMEPGVLVDALENKQISASLFMDFLVITFMEGYTVLGGFNQLEYLPLMQAAHLKCLEELGQKELVSHFASLVTDGLICGMFPFDFASGIDLIWHYNSQGGRFNGNLDSGLTGEDLDRMGKMKVREMIKAAVGTMMDSVGPRNNGE